MWKAISAAGSALAAAALIAGAITLLPGMSQNVIAGTQPSIAKTDRLDYRPLGSECSQRGWPYFENGCLRDPSDRRGFAKEVRIVTPDRVPAFAPKIEVLPEWAAYLPATHEPLPLQLAQQSN